MTFQVYKDPTFEKAAALELKQKGCMACKKYQYIIKKPKEPQQKHEIRKHNRRRNP